MWNNFPLRYFDGAKPGLKRKSKSSDESNSSSIYESHRKKRSFSTSWQAGRDWLVFNADKDVMTCSLCIQYHATVTRHSNLKNQDTFVTGCSNFRLSTVTDHEISRNHDKALSWSQAKEKPAEKSCAGKALINLKSAERHRLCFLFRNAHAVCKQNRPLSDYEWLCKIDQAKNIDIGTTYLKEKAALDFLSYISGTEKSKTTRHLKSSPFFSFMMDGSTDIAGDEQEAVFVRTSMRGEITERFLFIGTPISTSSADLFSFVLNTFADYDIDQAKLVGMGSDGAANMVGVRSGLATRMREISPEMLNIHCLCHRLELSFRDVVKSNKLYDKLMTLLIGFHYFYTKQYKNKAGLLRAIEAVGNHGNLPPKVTGTRWLPHLSNGITCLIKTFRAYEAHLSTISHTNPKAEGLLKLMINKHVVAFMLFLQMLIQPLMKLSLKLQRTETSLADSLIWVETTVELLDEAKNKFWQ